jgi:uncharacterized protein (TIGR02271 family)
MESSTFGHVSDWNEVIKKEARGRNNADLGEVQEVNENFVITEKGTLNKEKFYLPKSIPQGYNGHTLLFDVTEEVAKEKFMQDPTSARQSSSTDMSEAERTAADIDSPIPVIEERLEVSKKETVEEATVIKEPLKETKTVEVELTHEELIIEKRSVDKTSTSTSSSEDIMQSKTEINIPLKREEVVVSKKPYVNEEIVIKKKPVTETKTITEQVTSEKVSVRDPDGNLVVEEEKEQQDQEEKM